MSESELIKSEVISEYARMKEGLAREEGDWNDISKTNFRRIVKEGGVKMETGSLEGKLGAEEKSKKVLCDNGSACVEIHMLKRVIEVIKEAFPERESLQLGVISSIVRFNFYCK